jgi:hypothetical protein
VVKYTVYETTNLVNGKFYIGVHKTVNSHDAYLGSGEYIERAVKKYGRDNFVKVILRIFDTQQEAWDKENELVEVHRNDPLCMNLRKGGIGGFDHINREGLQKKWWDGLSDEEKREWKRKAGKNAGVLTPARIANLQILQEARKGMKLSDEWRRNMSQARQGIGGSSAQKWMSNPELGLRKRVGPEEQLRLLAEGWVFGAPRRKRKMNHSTAGKIWINNGSETKYIDKKDFGDYPSWVRGRIGKLFSKSCPNEAK